LEPLYYYSGSLIILAILLGYLTFRIFTHKDQLGVGATRALNATYVGLIFMVIIFSMLIMVEHYQGSNYELTNKDGYSVVIREKIKKIHPEDAIDLTDENYYVDPHAGFYVTLPEDSLWIEPKKLKGMKAYLKNANLEGNKTNIQSFLKWNRYSKLLECVFEDITMHPYNEMLFCLEQSLLFSEIGPALHSSQSILFTHTTNIDLEIVTTGPNPFSVHQLRGKDLMKLVGKDKEKAEKQEQRPNTTQISFNNYFNVTVLDKSNLQHSVSDLSAYLLKHTLNFASEADQLIASEGNVLFTSSFTFENARYQGNIEKFRINRWVRFIEESDRLHILEMVYSPESDPENNIWKDMRLLFESFGKIGEDPE